MSLGGKMVEVSDLIAALETLPREATVESTGIGLIIRDVAGEMIAGVAIPLEGFSTLPTPANMVSTYDPALWKRQRNTLLGFRHGRDD